MLPAYERLCSDNRGDHLFVAVLSLLGGHVP